MLQAATMVQAAATPTMIRPTCSAPKPIVCSIRRDRNAANPMPAAAPAPPTMSASRKNTANTCATLAPTALRMPTERCLRTARL